MHPIKDATAKSLRAKKTVTRFQSMHPIKDATQLNAMKREAVRFQSMHPIKDATIY